MTYWSVQFSVHFVRVHFYELYQLLYLIIHSRRGDGRHELHKSEVYFLPKSKFQILIHELKNNENKICYFETYIFFGIDISPMIYK